MRTLKLQGLHHGQYLVGMTIDLDIAPNPDDPAVRPDQNRGANNAEESLAIHRFFAPHPVGLKHLMLFIRDERGFEAMLIPKGFLGAWRVGRNTEDRGVPCGERAR